MKRYVFPFCAGICLLLLLVPLTSAVCNYTLINNPPTTPYVPPGPYGSISVESSPTGAMISINGEGRGYAPLTVSGLWPGNYRITATMSGYEEYTTTTTISGPTRSPVYCPLVPLNGGNLLRISSSPSDAEVFLDGSLRGNTPLTLASPVGGTHTIRLALDGYNDWKTTIDTRAEGVKTIAATLVPGSSGDDKGLNVSSDPSGATVMLDGLAKGKTPLTLRNLAPGIHILEIVYPGYSAWKSTVDVPEFGIKPVAVTLDPESVLPPGWITVSSSPSDARVTLDGNYVGRTPKDRSLNLDAIPAGKHTIGLDLPGFVPYSTIAMVSSNQVTAVSAFLRPDANSLTGALSVTSDPEGATVLVDNSTRGISPLTAGDLAPGSHQVLVTKEGYQDYSASIQVSPGTTNTISVSLLAAKPTLKTPVLPLTIVLALGIFGLLIRRKPE